MHRIAFVTSQPAPEIAPDDQLAVAILQSEGFTVEPAPWEDSSLPWTEYSAVIIRSPWNYSHHSDAFADWLRFCQSTGVCLWNPAEVVLGNINKRYLLDFERNGFPIVPSAYMEAGSKVSLAEILQSKGWEEAVVKPAISAGAFQTWRTSIAQAQGHQPRFEDQCQSGEVIIQPFLPEVVNQGELSLIYFNGEFSHCILKQPATGDFRVQPQHGGTCRPIDPPPHLIEHGRAILEFVGSPLLYARVDGILRDGQFLLMELEINEPNLFMQCSPEAPERFAAAIQSVLRTKC